MEKNTSEHPNFIKFIFDGEEKDGVKVLHLDTKKFSEDFVEAIQNNTLENFRELYRNYEKIIISNLEFLDEKPKTQEELRHLIDSYTDRCTMVMFLLSKQPNEFKNFDSLLMSRINSSMIFEFGESVAK